MSLKPVLILILILFTGINSTKAQKGLSKGTFTVQDGNYLLDAELKDGVLMVYEPNRTTPYTLMSADKYQYYHEKFKKTYYVEVVDQNTLYFTSSNVQGTTVLKRVGGAALSNSQERHDNLMQIAQKYKDLAASTIDDDYEVQAYTFCAATALTGAMKTQKEYQDYAKEAAQALKLISVNPKNNPCSDAIPDSIWKSVSTP